VNSSAVSQFISARVGGSANSRTSSCVVKSSDVLRGSLLSSTREGDGFASRGDVS
jgi:hypothetical protein